MPGQGERQTQLSLLTNFGFKLVVSLALPRTHQKITHSAGEGGREGGREVGRELESDQCSPARKPRFARAVVRRACASSSCHTWSPNYVASRGLNTHCGGSSRLLAAAVRSPPKSQRRERRSSKYVSPPSLLCVCVCVCVTERANRVVATSG